MLKYLNVKEVFSEVPDEISLAISITGCCIHCSECNQKELWEDIGKPLTWDSLNALLHIHHGITCVCFLGGDNDIHSLYKLAAKVKQFGLKVCWYSGYDKLREDIDLNNFDFIKVGRFNAELGPLTSKTTNQKFYKVTDGKLEDITYKFHRV